MSMGCIARLCRRLGTSVLDYGISTFLAIFGWEAYRIGHPLGLGFGDVFSAWSLVATQDISIDCHRLCGSQGFGHGERFGEQGLLISNALVRPSCFFAPNFQFCLDFFLAVVVGIDVPFNVLEFDRAHGSTQGDGVG